MLTANDIQVLKDQLAAVQTAMVIFPETPRLDIQGSAAALFLGLQQLQKEVTLLTPVEVPREENPLMGIGALATQLGNKNLQMSFAYQEEMVDKVSYHIDEETSRFNLVIQPKKNAHPLDASTVEFSYTGVAADMIFLVGVTSLDSLQQLYDGYEDFFANTTVVSVNAFETDFGTIRLNTTGSASFAEAMAFLLQEIGAEITPEIATNLLLGIEEATDGFRSLGTTADTFEIASKLMRSGARRMSRARLAAVAAQTSGASGNAQGSNGFAQALSRKSEVMVSPITPISIEQSDQLEPLLTPLPAKPKVKKSFAPAAPAIQQLQHLDGGVSRM
jgi:hypothetical protein